MDIYRLNSLTGIHGYYKRILFTGIHGYYKRILFTGIINRVRDGFYPRIPAGSLIQNINKAKNCLKIKIKNLLKY